MAQGLVHSQPLFFASPLPSPQAFLGTLPAMATVRESKSRSNEAKDKSGEVTFLIFHPVEWSDLFVIDYLAGLAVYILLGSHMTHYVFITSQFLVARLQNSLGLV